MDKANCIFLKLYNALHRPDRLNTENISFTLNSACCSMCLSKYGLETVLKSHCKH